jgi:peptidoglycan/LPS O-acetylase OafA/YrhL
VKQIGAIQILRAVAALMVVLSHAQGDALLEAVKAGESFTRFTLLALDAGVDLFFVISGFIMVHASQGLFAKPGASGSFLSRRLIRIVPLYWLITAIFLIIFCYIAWVGKRSFPSLAEIAASLSFVPFARPEDGEPRPFVSLGWTLNYEMFFYVIFACFVRFNRDLAISLIALVLALAVGAGMILHPAATVLAYWSDPIVLEFVLGMFIARLWQNGFALQRGFVLPLVVIGLALLAFDYNAMAHAPPGTVEINGFGRLFGCGVPMALIFAAIVLARPGFSTESRWASSLAFLGDASYALYLFHPLVIIFARKAYMALGLPSAIGFWPLVLADLPLAVILAIIVHMRVEKPVSSSLQAWLRQKSAKPDVKPLIAEIHPR